MPHLSWHRQWSFAVGIYFICVEQWFDFTTYMNLIWKRNMSLGSHQNFGMWEKNKRIGELKLDPFLHNYYFEGLWVLRDEWMCHGYDSFESHWEFLNGSKGNMTLCNHQRALCLLTEVARENLKREILCTKKACAQEIWNYDLNTYELVWK